jgi:hypothetical protein
LLLGLTVLFSTVAIAKWLVVVVKHANLCDICSDDQAPVEMAVCEHYNQDCEKMTHSPSSSCYPTPVIRVCDPPDVPGKPMHCFALWHNVSGVVTAIVKGCWVNCEVYSENCVGYPVAPVQDGYYCCCNTAGCNRNMSWSGNTWPTTLLPPFRKSLSNWLF